MPILWCGRVCAGRQRGTLFDEAFLWQRCHIRQGVCLAALWRVMQLMPWYKCVRGGGYAINFDGAKKKMCN